VALPAWLVYSWASGRTVALLVSMTINAALISFFVAGEKEKHISNGTG
jgi:hypothetical protein